MRLFITPDGKSGAALKGDDIVSVFKHPDLPVKGFASSALALTTQEGGRRLDAFDTELPNLYARSGFRAVARIPWNDDYKPEGWEYGKYDAFNNGRPDVVFMVHDPQLAKPYQKGDGARVADYDAGTAAQLKATGYAPGIKARGDIGKVKQEWIDTSPIKTLDQAVALAPTVQKGLGDSGRSIAKQLGVEFQDPGPKTKSAEGIERVRQKMEARRGKISAVTDLARAAFVIDKPAQADAIAEQLATKYEVLAEAWRTTPSNYTDRALLIRDKTGMVGEVQIMDRSMWNAKMEMHKLYEEARVLPADSPRLVELNAAMRVTFGRVLENYPPDWKASLGIGGTSGNSRS